MNGGKKMMAKGKEMMVNGNGAFDVCQAEYWERTPGGAVACRLCPHGCTLADGQRGLCRSRVNSGGRLVSEAYGRVCALAVDPVEKKPLLHFHPGGRCLSLAAAGCNLACRWCQNHAISQAAAGDVPWRRLAPADVARLAGEAGCRMVAYTYTEPLTYIEYTRDCARACRERGLANILVTAGYVEAAPLAALLPYVDAANVDLKSFSADIYAHCCRAALAPVLRTLTMMRDAGVWVEVTNLVIPGVTDNLGDIERMCRWLASEGFADSPLHFSRFFPSYRMTGVPPTPTETLVNARKVAADCGLNYVYIGNVSLPGAEDTRCPRCGTVLIRRSGYSVSTASFGGRCHVCGQEIAGRFGPL